MDEIYTDYTNSEPIQRNFTPILVIFFSFSYLQIVSDSKYHKQKEPSSQIPGIKHGMLEAWSELTWESEF
jgi:hypothetical protein